MAPRKGGLGKGLDSLIPNKESKNTQEVEASKAPAKKTTTARKTTPKKASTTVKKTTTSSKSSESNTSSIKSDTIETIVKISLVEPDKNQPRKEFNETALQELADSIKKYGVIQPLVVKKIGSFYQIIAGERRWRAAKMAGLKEVPVILREYTDQEMVEISIIENIQREDLNPIEESLAYQRLIDEFHLTQEEVAEKVSKSRVSITNSLRLLKLNAKVQKMVVEGKLTQGHARALLSLEDQDKQLACANVIVAKNMSVRETERFISNQKKPVQETLPLPKDDPYVLYYKEMEEKMKETLGSKVSIKQKTKKKGKIEIEYYSQSDLEVIYNTILSIKRR